MVRASVAKADVGELSQTSECEGIRRRKIRSRRIRCRSASSQYPGLGDSDKLVLITSPALAATPLRCSAGLVFELDAVLVKKVADSIGFGVIARVLGGTACLDVGFDLFR